MRQDQLPFSLAELARLEAMSKANGVSPEVVKSLIALELSFFSKGHRRGLFPLLRETLREAGQSTDDAI